MERSEEIFAAVGISAAIAVLIVALGFMLSILFGKVMDIHNVARIDNMMMRSVLRVEGKGVYVEAKGGDIVFIPESALPLIPCSDKE
jgi:hypothetical protein